MALAPPRAEPPTRGDFARLMAGFAPFEREPHLAVAFSGGGDSMALVLLAQDWAQRCNGRITALTVDHGLRPDSAQEAAQVAAWCAARGVAHAILRRTGPAPSSGIQAEARAARYSLLERWCAERGVLHLLTAHHREDQAETVLMRMERSSGGDGLAGMASVAERRAIRLLRPLLGVERARLRALLAARGEIWIEDPSNENPRFTRVRLRRQIAAGAGVPTAHQLAAIGKEFGAARAALEAVRARLLARTAMLHPAGFAWLDPLALAAPPELGMEALAAIIVTVSGSVHSPRSERLKRLYTALARGLAGGGRTLGGCLVLQRRGRLLICREPAAVAPAVAVVPGQRACWDERFVLGLDGTAPPGLVCGALGDDAPAIARDLPPERLAGLPPAVRAALPALRCAKGVVAVPALGYFGSGHKKDAWAAALRVEFRPRCPLAGARFTIV